MTSIFSRFHRPSLAISVCFAAAFVVLIALGVWQLQRLAWKEALIERIEQSRTKSPVTTLPDIAAFNAATAASRSEGPASLASNRNGLGGGTPPRQYSSLEFHTARLTGRFVQDTEFHVTPRYFKGQLGYHIFAPFTLEDGRVMLVNRGWVPARQKKPESRPESAPPKGVVTLTGMLRIEGERAGFTPISQPEKNIWFARDLAQMAAFEKLGDMLPLSLDVVAEQDATRLPIPSNGTIPLRNDHLKYAITWFLIALSGLVIFAVYHRR